MRPSSILQFLAQTYPIMALDGYTTFSISSSSYGAVNPMHTAWLPRQLSVPSSQPSWIGNGIAQVLYPALETNGTTLPILHSTHQHSPNVMNHPLQYMSSTTFGNNYSISIIDNETRIKHDIRIIADTEKDFRLRLLMLLVTIKYSGIGKSLYTIPGLTHYSCSIEDYSRGAL